MEQPKQDRALRMLAMMLQHTRRYSASQMAEQLGVDRRTIYRYINTFNEAGYVVLTDHHHIRLATGTAIHKQLSDLLFFNQEEAMTLYNAIESIETDTRLKEELKSKLATIYGTSLVTEKLMRMEKNHNTKHLMEAIEKRRRAILKGYSSPSSNTQRDRLVEPFALSEDKKYVWAFELESAKNKVFRISRIQSVEMQEQVCLCSRLHKKGYMDAFRNISNDGSTLPARIRMKRRAYNLLMEEYPLCEQDIIPTDSHEEWILDT
ncbi:MAG: HTH domain-containing protein, partial [Bacteroidaceae bacterium]|nr:HTH domain-containing protein [Bacteroidaceae bacterium]